MEDNILHLARIEPRKVNNRQLQPSATIPASHTDSLSEEQISIELTPDPRLRLQKEEVAEAIELKLDRKAPLARVLAARGHSLESARALLQPISLEVIPDPIKDLQKWKVLVDATDRLLAQVRQRGAVTLTHDDTMKSVVASAIVQSSLHQIHVTTASELSGTVTVHIESLPSERPTYQAEWSSESHLVIRGSHPERMALLLSRCLHTRAKEQLQLSFPWEQNIRLAALAIRQEGVLDRFEEAFAIHASQYMNTAPEDTPGLLVLKNGIIGPKHYTPLEIQHLLRPFLQSAIDQGYADEVVNLLAATDLRIAKDIFSLLATHVAPNHFMLNSCHLDLAPRSDTSIIADTELLLSEVTHRLETQIRAYCAADPDTTAPLFLIRNLSVESLMTYDDHVRVVLSDGSQKITGFLAPSAIPEEMAPDQRIHVIGELIHHQLPHEEVGIRIRQAVPVIMKEWTAEDLKDSLADPLPSYTTQFETIIANTPETIRQYSRELGAKQSGILAFDIETTLEAPQKACLYTFTDWEAKKNYVFDAVRGKRADGVTLYHDMSPLSEVLHSESARQLIIQNEHFERSVLAREGLFPRGVIDTIQELKRLRPDIVRVGLRDGLYWCCDFMLSKDEQTSDWTKREVDGSIPHAQLAYAIGDTEKLAEYYETLRTLDEKTSIPATYRVADLVAGMVQEKRLLYDFVTEHCPDYFFLQAKQNILRGVISSRLETGILPASSRWGLGNGAARGGTIEPEAFKKRFTRLCEGSVAPEVIEATLSSLLQETISKTDAKQLLAKEQWKGAGFPNDTTIDDFLATVSRSSRIGTRAEIILKYQRPTIELPIEINPDWDMSSYFREYTATYEQLLTLKKEHPRIVEGELRLRKLQAQIDYLFSHHNAPPYHGRFGSARPRTKSRIDIEAFRTALHERADEALGHKEVEHAVRSLIKTTVSKGRVYEALRNPQFEDSPLYAPFQLRLFLQSVSVPSSQTERPYVRPGKL